jgi:transposase
MTMTAALSPERAKTGGMDEPDPAARARRRSFTAEYKAAILGEYEALPEHSREGLYTSHVAEWRRARDTAPAPAAKTRPGKRSAEQVELDRLRRRNERLEAELARTKLALEITGKAHALLELISESADFETRPTK